MLIMFIFGGKGLADFALTICIGVVIGTLSSSFVATPIVYEWMKRKESEEDVAFYKHRIEELDRTLRSAKTYAYEYFLLAMDDRATNPYERSREKFESEWRNEVLWENSDE